MAAQFGAGEREREDGMSMTLTERVAAALGWSVEDVQSMSYQSLRDLVRPVSEKLAAELTSAMRSGAYIGRTA